MKSTTASLAIMFLSFHTVTDASQLRGSQNRYLTKAKTHTVPEGGSIAFACSGQGRCQTQGNWEYANGNARMTVLRNCKVNEGCKLSCDGTCDILPPNTQSTTVTGAGGKVIASSITSSKNHGTRNLASEPIKRKDKSDGNGGGRSLQAAIKRTVPQGSSVEFTCTTPRAKCSTDRSNWATAVGVGSFRGSLKKCNNPSGCKVECSTNCAIKSSASDSVSAAAVNAGDTTQQNQVKVTVVKKPSTSNTNEGVRNLEGSNKIKRTIPFGSSASFTCTTSTSSCKTETSSWVSSWGNTSFKGKLQTCQESNGCQVYCDTNCAVKSYVEGN